MNTLGHKLRVTVFGQSHAPAIGCVVEGLPAGFIPDMDRLAAFLARRAPGRTAWSTPRQESDAPEILSGLVEGRTCGAPVCAVIRNGDQRSRDYEGLRRTPRPSHADYTAWVKYGESYDIRGGGQFSGRLTAPLCFAGALALQLLEERGVTVAAHIGQIGGVYDEAPDFAAVDRETLNALLARPFPVFREDAGGVLGGITTGMPLVVNVAFKPTASIPREQDTVDLKTMKNTRLTIHGRHDPCIVPRAVPVVEAVTALTLLDMMLEEERQWN